MVANLLPAVECKAAASGSVGVRNQQDMALTDPYTKYGIEALRFAERIDLQTLGGDVTHSTRDLALALYGSTPLLQETVLAHINRIRRREVTALLRAWANGATPDAGEAATARAAFLANIRTLADQGYVAGLQFEALFFEESPTQEESRRPAAPGNFDLVTATPLETVDYWFALADRGTDREMALDAALDADLDPYSRAALEAVLSGASPPELESRLTVRRDAWLAEYSARLEVMRTGLVAISERAHPETMAKQLADLLGDPPAAVDLLELGQAWAFPVADPEQQENRRKRLDAQMAVLQAIINGEGGNLDDFPEPEDKRMPPLTRATPTRELAAHLLAFAWIGRKMGNLALECYAEGDSIGEPYLRLGLRLISEGCDALLVARILTIRKRALLAALALKADMLGDFLAALAGGAHRHTARELMRAYLPE